MYMIYHTYRFGLLNNTLFCFIKNCMIKQKYSQVPIITFTKKQTIKLMIPKQSIITPEIIKQRQERHRRLLRMIRNYKRNNQQISKLQRIKNNTVLEINLRFIKSQHNKNYIFPKSKEDSQQEEKQVNPFTIKDSQFYDLRAQNQITKQGNLINNKLNESARRVKSLDRQKSDIDAERLGRFQQTKGVYSYKKLKKSVADVKKVVSTIKLPQLSKKQNVKTQIRNDSLQFDKIIGKKLLTQTNSPRKKEVVSSRQLHNISKKNLQNLKKMQ